MNVVDVATLYLQGLLDIMDTAYPVLEIQSNFVQNNVTTELVVLRSDLDLKMVTMYVKHTQVGKGQ